MPQIILNMKKLVLIIFLIGLFSASHAQIQEVPYTLDDRDRVIRVEAKMEALEIRMNALESKMDIKFEALETQMDIRFEAINNRIDYLFSLITFIAMLMIFMLGYMIWDRRTALKPALDKAAQSDTKSSSVLSVLRDFARKNADLAEAMRTHGLL